MRGSRWLVAASTAQLAVTAAGLGIALRRKYAYDWLFMHGNPDRIGVEVITHGTGLSAPAYMLASQVGATLALHRAPDADLPTKVLGVLGAAMVPGYLGERIVRRRLSTDGWDPVESPVAIAGVALAAAMALIAFRGHR